MTEKEEKVLKEIQKFYKENKLMPTIRYLKERLKYKSNYSIQLYLKKLEQENYLIRNNNKLILNELINNNPNAKTIKIINTKEEISIILNKRKKYLAYKIKSNDFQEDMIKKGDIVIIECKKKINNNDLGLFIIDHEYQIMKYFYKDGFHILKGKNELILNKIKLIGKVILVERKI